MEREYSPSLFVGSDVQAVFWQIALTDTPVTGAPIATTPVSMTPGVSGDATEFSLTDELPPPQPQSNTKIGRMKRCNFI